MSSPIKLSSDSDVSEYSNEVEVVELTQPQAHSGKPFYKITSLINNNTITFCTPFADSHVVSY